MVCHGLPNLDTTSARVMPGLNLACAQRGNLRQANIQYPDSKDGWNVIANSQIEITITATAAVSQSHTPR